MHIRPIPVLICILAAHAGLLAWTAAQHSPAYDEVGHVAAGLYHWEEARFDLYRVNPPLVRLLATLPLVAMRVSTPPKEPINTDPPFRPEFGVGEQFISYYGLDAFWYVTVARWMCLPFSLLGAWICYLWGRDLYGQWGGVLAATLWAFCPNILANAQMITPDTGATALGAASCYLFWKWLRQPTWGWAIAAGITLGLAELCKMSWIILFVLWPLTWVAWQLTWFRERETRWGEQIRQLGLALTLAVLLINLGYGFEETGRPLGSFRFFSAALKGVDPHTNGEAVESHWVQLSPGNRFQGTWAAAIPILLPSNYVAGIDNQRLDFEQGYRSYLRGEWRHGGWWYYYLYGLAVKWPIGTWVVLVLAAGLWILRFPFGPGLRNELILLAPAITLLVLVSSQTGFNHHLRYILPIFPILFIWAGRTVMPGTATYLKATAWLAVTAAAVSSLAVYPHSMSYFNELAGGPERGHEHLLDSNMDWGQDLLYLKRWLDEHPEAQALGLAFFGRFDPNAAGIEFTLPPVLPPSPDEWAGLPLDQLGPRPGWYAVSVNLMHGAHVRVSAGGGKSVNLEEGFFEYFRWFKPVARAGYSIYIYHLDYDECNRVRADHGLTLLERVDSPYLLP